MHFVVDNANAFLNPIKLYNRSHGMHKTQKFKIRSEKKENIRGSGIGSDLLFIRISLLV